MKRHTCIPRIRTIRPIPPVPMPSKREWCHRKYVPPTQKPSINPLCMAYIPHWRGEAVSLVWRWCESAERNCDSITFDGKQAALMACESYWCLTTERSLNESCDLPISETAVQQVRPRLTSCRQPRNPSIALQHAFLPQKFTSGLMYYSQYLY